MRALCVTLLAGTITLIGCGDPSTLTREEAAQVWQTTGTSAATLASQAGSGGSALSITSASQNVSYSQDCSHGGNVALDGDMSASISNSESMSAQANLSAVYNACDENGYVVDGNLNMNMTVDYGSDQMSTRLDMNGIISVEGEVEGTCSINLSMTTDINTSTYEYEYTYQGTVCGYEAETLIEGNYAGGDSATAGNDGFNFN